MTCVKLLRVTILKEQLPESKMVSVNTEMVDILSKVIPGMMNEAQEEDIDTSKTLHYVKSGKKLTFAQI